MSEYTINSDQDELNFKTRSFVQNDLLLSLLYFGLILILPLIVWNHVDSYLIFVWQGCMLAIYTARWLCRYAFNQADEQSINEFWSGAVIFLTLLDGLGWGVSGALFFPADSMLSMSLVALLLIGIGGVGTVTYSARMLVAIPYILCVVLPYATRLYLSGGQEEFLITCTLGLLSIMFCFAADRLNLTLNTALDIDHQDEQLILTLEDENQRLRKIIDREGRRSRSLEDQISNNSNELQDVHSIITKYGEELHLLSGQTVHLLNSLNSLKHTELNQEQSQLISKIETIAQQLSDNLNLDQNTEETVQASATDAQETGTKADTSVIKQVLVVDDDKGELKKIEATLRELGLAYESVENVPAALAVLCEAEAKNTYFDLVIANLWMPEMDGISFAECLQDDPEFQGVKIILISSDELPGEKRLQKAGVNIVIHKPVRQEELIQAISNLLEGSVPNYLPPSIEAMVDDAIRVSIPDSEMDTQTNVSPDMIDQYVIEGLRSSTINNFIEVVNDYLEEAPQLIDQARTAFNNKNYPDLVKVIRELGSRSLHMGAKNLVESARAIEETISSGGKERVMGMLQTIDAEFIRVESALLAELTNGTLLSKEIKH